MMTHFWPPAVHVSIIAISQGSYLMEENIIIMTVKELINSYQSYSRFHGHNIFWEIGSLL